MIKWLSPPETKIVNWRQFRNAVSSDSLSVGLNEIAFLWAHCPKIKRAMFDITDTINWPDPWQLLSQSTYCEYSQTLGIYYTIQMIPQFNAFGPKVEVCEIAGTLQSRVKVDGYYVDLNSKMAVAAAPDTRLKVIYTLTKIIEN